MCEFKVSNRKDGDQIAEEILVLSYSEDKTLQLRDILGVSKEIDSGLIFDVNTLDQTCTIIQHPIVKPFLEVIDKLNKDSVTSQKIDSLIGKLEEIKNTL